MADLLFQECLQMDAPESDPEKCGRQGRALSDTVEV
jgi:hypothetical protein